MKVVYSHGPLQGETVTVPDWRGRDLIRQGAAVEAVPAKPDPSDTDVKPVSSTKTNKEA